MAVMWRRRVARRRRSSGIWCGPAASGCVCGITPATVSRCFTSCARQAASVTSAERRERAGEWWWRRASERPPLRRTFCGPCCCTETLGDRRTSSSKHPGVSSRRIAQSSRGPFDRTGVGSCRSSPPAEVIPRTPCSAWAQLVLAGPIPAPGTCDHLLVGSFTGAGAAGAGVAVGSVRPRCRMKCRRFGDRGRRPGRAGPASRV